MSPRTPLPLLPPAAPSRALRPRSIALASSNDPSIRCGGRKPAAVPSTRCGPLFPAVRTGEVAGSSAMMRVAAPACRRRSRHRPACPRCRRPRRTHRRGRSGRLIRGRYWLAFECVGVVGLICPERIRIFCELGDPGLEAVEIAGVPSPRRSARPRGRRRRRASCRVSPPRRRPMTTDGTGTLHRTDHRQGRTRAAACELDDAHARSQGASPFGAVNHRERHSVLVRPCRSKDLSLTTTSAEPGGTSPCSRTNGVRPIVWSTELARAGYRERCHQVL